MKNSFLFLSFLFIFSSCSEKEVTLLPIDANIYQSSMRGLYAVNEEIIWATGTAGVVMRMNNNKWESFQDTTWAKLDFRDVHAFDKNEAIIMSSGDGCEIYKTKDAAQTWHLVYENHAEGIFFDGMDFWDDKNGLAFSDPIHDQLYIIATKDGGDSWYALKSIDLPQTLKSEAGFAASGTGIVCAGDSTVYIGTGGGTQSRVFISNNRGKSWNVINTPMRPDEASGIYSLAFIDELNGVAVGGNYLDSSNTKGNCSITSDGGLTWRLSKTPPIGYMSCVTSNNDGILLCTGRSGVDVSFDKGLNWKHVSDDAYYSCVLHKSSGWLTGRDGKMAQVIIN